MTTPKMTVRPRSWRSALAPVLLLLQAACFVPYAQMVRDAQDAFSKGAQLENLVKLGDGLEQLPLEEPDRYYATARGLVDQAVAESKAELERDHLYGTALTIHALASWRLGDKATAQRSAGEVVDLASDPAVATRVWPRDHSICLALESLMLIDDLGVTAGKVGLATTSGEFGSRVIAPVATVVEGLDGAARLLPEGHPARLYLSQAKAELAFVLNRGLTNMSPDNRDHEHIATYDRIRQQALADLAELAAAARDIEARAAIERRAGQYRARLGFVPGPRTP